ncbi:HTH-type transcriptional regulator Xre [Oxobacter pfennigii]|uniref:HTH-type transcriptional regulator Xre n=1 Tax=Oxobacter pfennigii TaxID=36849 RepID=A0A0P8Z101_9CLOT|nr:helix-turn-helix transcriptional regulator [Oxobacter pfennigii]KPU45806.1 HTH-type transcriptional regulator Xre [Oxobacter pfennigii]
MLGSRIRELRLKKGLTQKELADSLGTAQSTIAMVESGKREVSFDLLIEIAGFFGVSTDYLLLGFEQGPHLYDSPAASTKRDFKNSITEESPAPFNTITDVKRAMEIILSQPGLMLNGEMLSDESKIALANAIQMGLAYAEQKQREENEKRHNYTK